MNRRLIPSVIFACAFVLYGEIAGAQQTPPPPPLHESMMVQAAPEGDFPPPYGERMELLGFGGTHGGKVVTGAPFSATAVSETTQTLSDGNHISRKTQSNVFRDSQGRIRREITLAGFGPMAPSGQPKLFVIINDPVVGATFMLHPNEKTAEKVPNPFAKMNGPMKQAMRDKMEFRRQEEANNVNVKKEDLGTQTIAGVAAQGIRMTKTIPAGQIGNEKPITIVREIWYSNELQTVVMRNHSDPWSGETSYTLTNIQRAEPDAALFSVPSDYTVTEGRTGRGARGAMRHSQAPPADN